MGLHYGVDLARMYTTTTGTGNVTLTTAVPGCKTFAASGVSDSDTVNYGIITYDLTTHRPLRSETGLGKYIASGTILQRNTVLHSTDSDDSAIDLTGLSEVYIPFLQKDILRVKESDSDPSVYPVNTIVVSNGTLTDNGDGQVTITTGGGAGSSVKYSSYAYSSADAITNNTDNNLLSIDTENVDADNISSLAGNTITIAATGWYLVSVNVYVDSGSNFNGRINVTLNTDAYNVNNAEGYSTADAIGLTINDMIYIGPVLFNFTANDTITVEIDNHSGATINATVSDLSILKL